jgi:glycosyltransferase A (GT-A) superfamily protein (DUF2064 family)
MSDAAPAVVIMARAPRRGTVHLALEPLIGAEGCVSLHTALLLRTMGWAREVGRERVFIAYEPPDARAELTSLLGAGATFFPQNGEGIASRTAAASAQVFAAGERPLLIVWPVLPRLTMTHAAGALDDLADGCDVVLGPVLDGGLYLVGVRRPAPALFGLPEHSWRSPELVGIAITAARRSGLQVGLLRTERALQRPADVRSALADPLLAPELQRVLRRRRHGAA